MDRDELLEIAATFAEEAQKQEIIDASGRPETKSLAQQQLEAQLALAYATMALAVTKGNG